jgi:hypothetical protein
MIVPAVAKGFLLIVTSSLLAVACAEDASSPSNETNLTSRQLSALLKEVQAADSKPSTADRCKPTGETPREGDTSLLLANASAQRIRSARKPPWALHPRDIEIRLNTSRPDVWLSVMIRVQSGRCVGYSLARVYS